VPQVLRCRPAACGSPCSSVSRFTAASVQDRLAPERITAFHAGSESRVERGIAARRPRRVFARRAGHSRFGPFVPRMYMGSRAWTESQRCNADDGAGALFPYVAPFPADAVRTSPQNSEGRTDLCAYRRRRPHVSMNSALFPRQVRVAGIGEHIAIEWNRMAFDYGRQRRRWRRCKLVRHRSITWRSCSTVRFPPRALRAKHLNTSTSLLLGSGTYQGPYSLYLRTARRRSPTPCISASRARTTKSQYTGLLTDASGSFAVARIPGRPTCWSRL